MMWIYAILFAVLIGLQFFGRDAVTPQEEVDQGKLIEMLKKEEVGKIELINKEDAEIFLNQKGLAAHFPEVTPNPDGLTSTANYTYRIGSLERFEEMVENAQQEVAHPVYITNVRRNNWMSDILAWVLPFGLLIVFWIVMMRGMGRNMGGGAGSIFNIGKSRALRQEHQCQCHLQGRGRLGRGQSRDHGGRRLPEEPREIHQAGR